MVPRRLSLAFILCAELALSADVYSPGAFGSDLLSADSECEVDEIQLASDGTIAQWGLALGTRVAPNMTVNGTITPDSYNFYHLCVGRHEHEHLISVELLCDAGDLSKGGDANVYLSSEVKYPRMGHSSLSSSSRISTASRARMRRVAKDGSRFISGCSALEMSLRATTWSSPSQTCRIHQTFGQERSFTRSNTCKLKRDAIFEDSNIK
ncbi:hypothetical protein DVH05_002406 [Phytophthora capsici]|nr:hypothetical protein DVH05_002406 [Phytophthora capsici]